MSLSFNGGKDCVVLLYLLVAVYYKRYQEIPNIKTIYVTHPNPFPDVEKYVNDCKDRYCLNLVKKKGPIKSALKEYKEENPEIEAILVGVRRNDPYGGN